MGIISKDNAYDLSDTELDKLIRDNRKHDNNGEIK